MAAARWAAVVLLVVVPPVGLLDRVGRLLPEELRDVVEHEPLALGVLQDPAVTADRLGDEQSLHRRGPDHPGRVELDELHVDQGRPGAQRQRMTVTGVLPGVRGDLPRLAEPAGREHDRRCVEDDEPARLPPVGERTRDRAIVLEQVGDGALHEHVDAERDQPLLKGADHLQAGAVADVREAGVAVAAEVALTDQPVRRTVEEGAPVLELHHPLGRLLGVELGHPPVVEHLPAAHGVAEVHLPVVLGVEVAHRGSGAALGHHRVRLAEQRLADHRDPRTGVVRCDRGAQAGATGADHDHVVLVPFDATLRVTGHLVAGHGVARRSAG